MGTHMKTTIEIADELLRQAKIQARREKTTLRAVIEEALRALISRRRDRKPAKFKPVVVKGRTPPEVFNWVELSKAVYADDENERLRRAGA